MLDRQDIDALLVSALYGELTPADEARLATHLESHPGDRAALDDLKVARQAVRDSRIFEVQLDPPQSLSALLLQEAARRAPRKVVDAERGESWFTRFVRSFVAHPAMAAAATLVLVVGVAGTLYLAKGGDQFAEQTAKQQQETVARTDEAPALAQPTSGASAGSASRPSDEGVDVKLADSGDETKNAPKHATDPKADKPAATPARERQVASNRGAMKKPGKIDVSRPEPAPKDLELAKTEAEENRFASPPGRTSAAGAGTATSPATTTTGLVGGVAAGPQQAQAPVAPAPPPPSPAMATVDKAPSTPAAKPDPKGAVKEDPTSSWARDTHARMTALVRAGKCPDAAPLAVQIKNRAPDYYNSYVANDRALKPCMAYINDAAERDAEKSQKSRPAKRAESLDNAK